ncbi:MAG: hypothetical protein NT076_04740 [Candidatus Pacearchaeota archaeon]|nr:hypothetical protein [Candidatus Pacearchaeota archaeon]
MPQQTIQGSSIEENRKLIEKNKNIILVLSHTDKKDKLKQRDSGLNQVLCSLAKQRNIVLAIDLEELLKEKDRKEKAKILSRILQNLRLIKKFKNQFKLLNPRNKSQAFSLLISLGFPTNLAKEAIN